MSVYRVHWTISGQETVEARDVDIAILEAEEAVRDDFMLNDDVDYPVLEFSVEEIG